MKLCKLLLVLVFLLRGASVAGTDVQVQKIGSGIRLVVDGQDFIVKGMNWSYYPIGTNHTYNLWDQSDEKIESVLATEMTLLKDMGVNTIRVYTGIPSEWIAHIYENFGIYTILNHPFGRWGLSVEGDWIANPAYDHPGVKAALMEGVVQLVEEYKDTPGLLLYLLGNENNYGLYWEEPEVVENTNEAKESALESRAMYKLFLLTKQQENDDGGESISIEERAEIRAQAMYRLFNEAAIQMKKADPNHPVGICNGDLMFLNLIKEECTSVDFLGTNMYRGISFGDTFQRVKIDLDKPILFTELGADAFNAITDQEDQESQAYYLKGNWKEIYANAAGIGGAENAIGGCTFQFSDGWWKHNQFKNLSIHDKTASWRSGGYYRDDKDGQNNMNEEWFGICAKRNIEEGSEYQLLPRASYFLLKKANQFSPYESSSTLVELEKHFAGIVLEEAIKESQAYFDSLVRKE